MCVCVCVFLCLRNAKNLEGELGQYPIDTNLEGELSIYPIDTVRHKCPGSWIGRGLRKRANLTTGKPRNPRFHKK